jgi:hypothetical protein
MPNLETVASPATVIMLLACILGLGFMVCFLVALTLDGRSMRAWHVRPEGVHYAADMACVEVPCRQTALGSAAHLAIEVVRITTALTSNAGLTNRHPSVDHLHGVSPGRPKQELDFTAERGYRSG